MKRGCVIYKDEQPLFFAQSFSSVISTIYKWAQLILLAGGLV